MSQTSLSVWFVCRLCRSSFGQVDAFIEHKKQKHFTQFQNTTCIVFEESEQSLLCPGITNTAYDQHSQLVNEINEPQIKIEVKNEDTLNLFSSEIIEEQNLGLVEPKSELITYESEIILENENSFFGLEQPEQNSYVLLKRLTSEEIQSACVPKHHYRLLKCEQKFLGNSSEPYNSFDACGSNTPDCNAGDKSTEIPPTAPVIHFPTESDLQFECKLCLKQLKSNGQLKIHMGICALYHEDQNRFCVTCNRKFCEAKILKRHRLRFHGTEEEKLSLYEFKCHVCPKQYQQAAHLRFHLNSHKETKEQVETSNLNPIICSHPNCGKVFRCNSDLQRHISAVHLDLRPFSCSFPNCNKKFALRSTMRKHFMIHTGERPFKCTVDNCNKAFTKSYNRSIHHRTVHRNFGP